MVNQVNEGVTERRATIEIDGHIHEIVLPNKALGVELLQEEIPCVAVRQISEEHSGEVGLGVAITHRWQHAAVAL